MDEKNKLYFGDNLKILREYVPDASVDLIYLDPPRTIWYGARPSTPVPRLSLGAVSKVEPRHLSVSRRMLR